MVSQVWKASNKRSEDGLCHILSIIPLKSATASDRPDERRVLAHDLRPRAFVTRRRGFDESRVLISGVFHP
jgi:hypothetical protein